MRKATLLYNARSGGRRKSREEELRAVLKILTEAGVEANLIRTQSSADATEQARTAILEGSDALFACGGDGTIHDVLQAVAGTRVALGVIPFGTANALAHDLGIPMDPVRAVRALLAGDLKRVAVGQATVRGFDGQLVTRFFTVAVGIGVDAHLFYKLSAGVKKRLGMAGYYAQAWHLWFTHRMERFQVDWASADGTESRDSVTEMLAVRIRHFGGALKELAPGASLERDDVRVVVCRTSNRASYLLYVIRGLLGRKWRVPGVELAHAATVRCDCAQTERQGKPIRVYVEADGELVGMLPAQITTVPDALTLLTPRKQVG